MKTINYINILISEQVIGKENIPTFISKKLLLLYFYIGFVILIYQNLTFKRDVQIT